MIRYEPKQCKLCFLFQWKGSVFPKSFAWALPACFIAVLSRHFFGQGDIMHSASQVWSGYNFVLGFLIVFRTQQAYARFWEGATMLLQVRGEWFNAVSSLFAFCSMDPAKKAEVDAFQHLLVRLMSLLYNAALQKVCMIDSGFFEVLDLDGISPESIQYLQEKPERAEIIMQWIQRLIVNAMDNGAVPIPPPVLSRAFQELSRGIVNVSNARKITEVPFPFPYVQMITVMLYIHWIITPIVFARFLNDITWVGTLTFTAVFAVQAINYIAEEIEMPFGEDANDLPILDVMISMNQSLMTLMEPRTQNPPEFRNDKTASVLAPQQFNMYVSDFESSMVPRSSSMTSLGFNVKLPFGTKIMGAAPVELGQHSGEVGDAEQLRPESSQKKSVHQSPPMGQQRTSTTSSCSGTGSFRVRGMSSPIQDSYTIGAPFAEPCGILPGVAELPVECEPLRQRQSNRCSMCSTNMGSISFKNSVGVGAGLVGVIPGSSEPPPPPSAARSPEKPGAVPPELRPNDCADTAASIDARTRPPQSPPPGFAVVDASAVPSPSAGSIGSSLSRDGAAAEAAKGDTSTEGAESVRGRGPDDASVSPPGEPRASTSRGIPIGAGSPEAKLPPSSSLTEGPDAQMVPLPCRGSRLSIVAAASEGQQQENLQALPGDMCAGRPPRTSPR